MAFFLVTRVFCVALLAVILCLAQVGSAWPYNTLALSPTTTPTAKNSYEGFSVASSGNVVAVGAPQCTITLSSKSAISVTTTSYGYVQIYTCTASSCAYQTKLMAPTTGLWGQSCFGYSVALTNSGQLLVVGAPYY